MIYNVPLYKKYGLKKKYYSSISSMDFVDIESPKNIYDLKDSAKEMLYDPKFMALDEVTKQKLLPWSEKGYVILENSHRF